MAGNEDQNWRNPLGRLALLFCCWSALLMAMASRAITIAPTPALILKRNVVIIIAISVADTHVFASLNGAGDYSVQYDFWSSFYFLVIKQVLPPLPAPPLLEVYPVVRNSAVMDDGDQWGVVLVTLFIH